MQPSIFVAFALVAGVFCHDSTTTPMQQTVMLIEDLEKNVVNDGKTEQASFDKYACWCEKTMERKASDIANAKELISETQILIKKLKGEIASHGAEIEQLEKDLSQNNQAVKEAEDLRSKQNKEYAQERSESEQCIGALEAAIKVLTGAGTKSFLQGGLHEAELLSVIQGVRIALSNKVVSAAVSSNDIAIVKHFVSRPDDFAGEHASALSAAQVGQNPFGDYAPQSSQIQGILKGMYDAFTADLEKDNVEESNAQKAFEELHATKMQERATLQATLQIQETGKAAKTKKLSDSEVLLDDTADAQKADEAFFEDTKESCQAKATEWSVRTRLRTEELNGMRTAIKILSSKDAKKTFKSATTTFVQLAAVNKHAQRSASVSAFNQLKKLATQFHSRSLAKIAVAVKTSGHFDKVITMIDDMIALLRTEEQEDIEHRDRCENSQNANANELDDLDHAVKKTEASLKRMNRESQDLSDEIRHLEGEMAATTADMEELLKFRNEEVKEFRQALKDDADAIGLLKQAIVALSKYYKNNKIDLPEFVQKAPEYAQDADKAPETAWSKSDSRKSETGGILAILEMLVEDLEKEMNEARADDADAQDKYSKQNGALQDTLDAESEAKTNAESEKANLEEKIASFGKYKDQKNADKKAELETKKSVATDCAWVKKHFDSRREKRQTETQGLVDAKGFLAGVAAGQDPLPLQL